MPQNTYKSYILLKHRYHSALCFAIQRKQLLLVPQVFILQHFLYQRKQQLPELSGARLRKYLIRKYNRFDSSLVHERLILIGSYNKSILGCYKMIVEEVRFSVYMKTIFRSATALAAPTGCIKPIKGTYRFQLFMTALRILVLRQARQGQQTSSQQASSKCDINRHGVNLTRVYYREALTMKGLRRLAQFPGSLSPPRAPASPRHVPRHCRPVDDLRYASPIHLGGSLSKTKHEASEFSCASHDSISLH